MKRLFMGMACLTLALAVQAEAPTPKAGSCEEKAVSKKTGKPLAGAAKVKFMRKCEAGGK